MGICFCRGSEEDVAKTHDPFCAIDFSPNQSYQPHVLNNQHPVNSQYYAFEKVYNVNVPPLILLSPREQHHPESVVISRSNSRALSHSLSPLPANYSSVLLASPSYVYNSNSQQHQQQQQQQQQQRSISPVMMSPSCESDASLLATTTTTDTVGGSDASASAANVWQNTHVKPNIFPSLVIPPLRLDKITRDPSLNTTSPRPYLLVREITPRVCHPSPDLQHQQQHQQRHQCVSSLTPPTSGRISITTVGGSGSGNTSSRIHSQSPRLATTTTVQTLRSVSPSFNCTAAAICLSGQQTQQQPQIVAVFPQQQQQSQYQQQQQQPQNSARFSSSSPQLTPRLTTASSSNTNNNNINNNNISDNSHNTVNNNYYNNNNNNNNDNNVKIVSNHKNNITNCTATYQEVYTIQRRSAAGGPSRRSKSASGPTATTAVEIKKFSTTDIASKQSQLNSMANTTTTTTNTTTTNTTTTNTTVLKKTNDSATSTDKNLKDAGSQTFPNNNNSGTFDTTQLQIDVTPFHEDIISSSTFAQQTSPHIKFRRKLSIDELPLSPIPLPPSALRRTASGSVKKTEFAGCEDSICQMDFTEALQTVPRSVCQLDSSSFPLVPIRLPSRDQGHKHRRTSQELNVSPSSNEQLVTPVNYGRKVSTVVGLDDFIQRTAPPSVTSFSLPNLNTDLDCYRL